MTDRDKVAHLLRRFGLGAGKLEVDTYAPLGVKGTLDRLLYFEKTPQEFLILPHRLCVDKPADDINLDSFFTSAYWALRMWMTSRPFEDKLTLFWSNHLAVGADKVDYAPMMVSYLQTLREKGTGKFSELLQTVAGEAAMIKYLDGDQNLAGRPNENFAREVMELFTLGIGHYTEHDVQEGAKVFSGFGLRYPVFEGDGKLYNKRAKEGIQNGWPLVGGYWSEALHDKSEKTMFGQTGRYTPSDLMTILAAKPEAAQWVSRNLWQFFAYRNPEQAIVDKVAKVFRSTEGNIREVVHHIAEMDEFWSPKAVRAIVKSPVDFTISIYRQLGLNAFLYKQQTPNGPLTRLPDAIRGGAFDLVDRLDKQGLKPLYPPTVKGWDWGDTWMTAQAMTEKLRLALNIFYAGDPGKKIGDFIGSRITAVKPSTDEEAILAYLDIFDAEPAKEHMDLFKRRLTQLGGKDGFGKPNTSAYVVSELSRLLFVAPEFQFC